MNKTQIQNVPLKNRGGRPRKFTGPSRPVTVTLSESTLDDLERIHPDRALAITKATDWAVGQGKDPADTLRIVKVDGNRSIITVGPSKSLKQIPWLRCVEIAPARFLIVLPTGTPVESLEIAIMDMLEQLPPTEVGERALLEGLRKYISAQRKTQSVSKAELLFVEAES